MPRIKRRPLRGSVTQNNTASLRLSANEGLSPKGFLIRLGALVGGVLLVLGTIAWLWHIGWPQQQVENVADFSLRLTQKMHFAVKDIIIIGRQQTPKESLNAALGIGLGDPILGVDPAEAQERIDKLPWVSSVIVERHLPDTLVVRITERAALARWQHKGRNVVIDFNGKELPDAKVEQFSNLPLVVGDGADENAKDLISAIKPFPAVAKNMTAATWVGERRWDIYLQPKIIAKMPEGDMSDALKRLTQLITEKKILERDVISIDLRLPDRLVIEPGHPTSGHPAGDMRL